MKNSWKMLENLRESPGVTHFWCDLSQNSWVCILSTIEKQRNCGRAGEMKDTLGSDNRLF